MVTDLVLLSRVAYRSREITPPQSHELDTVAFVGYVLLHGHVSWLR